uniref:Conotoxin n=1 Tax=Conus betulinus TaxID=89764 RepID=A0A142C1J3_CONBE|nr:conotoxin [Conus betulinus]
MMTLRHVLLFTLLLLPLATIRADTFACTKWIAPEWVVQRCREDSDCVPNCGTHFRCRCQPATNRCPGGAGCFYYIYNP